MSSHIVGRLRPLALFALATIALAAPLASQAASSSTTPAAPSVVTGGARMSGAAGVLEGSVNPHTLTTTYYFKYGPNVAPYEQQTATATLKGGPNEIDTEKVSAVAPGIKEGWHYVLVASNADGPPQEGRDHVFKVKVKLKTKKPAFVLAKSFPPTPIGSTFVLDGTLAGTGSANRAIVLQATPYPYTAAYATVGAPILTGPTGAFSFHVAGLTSSTKFRVATASAPLLFSKIVPEQVSVRVILKARQAGHDGLVRLYGTVTPAEVGAHVYFQLEKVAKPKLDKPGKLEKPGKEKAEKEKPPVFSTKFATVVKRATKTISRFSFVLSVRDAGHYRAFVQVRPGPLASGTSSTVLLNAAKKKAKKKKG
jgi:hypothetical protein